MELACPKCGNTELFWVGVIDGYYRFHTTKGWKYVGHKEIKESYEIVSGKSEGFTDIEEYDREELTEGIATFCPFKYKTFTYIVCENCSTHMPISNSIDEELTAMRSSYEEKEVGDFEAEEDEFQELKADNARLKSEKEDLQQVFAQYRTKSEAQLNEGLQQVHSDIMKVVLNYKTTMDEICYNKETRE